MKAGFRRVYGRLVAALIRFLQKLLWSKSDAQVHRFGERFGRFLHRIDRKRRMRADSNLQLAMPSLTEAERKRIVLGCFEHFGRTAADFLVLPRRNLADLESSTEITGYEVLEEALGAGKGAILMTGHFGSWERSGAIVGHRGINLGVVIRDANEQSFNREVNKIRESSGAVVIPRGQGTIKIMRILKKGGAVAILADQNTAEAVIDFFGKPAGTALGAGLLHEKTGAPCVPAVCYYVGNGKYRLEVSEPLVPVPGMSVPEGLMLAFNRYLEAEIVKRPEQWLWIHDRWRYARQEGLL